MAPTRTPRRRAWHVLVLVFLSILVGETVAQAPDAPVNGTGNGFLQVQLPSMGVYQAATAEDTLTAALSLRFSPASVQCVDLRVSTTAAGSPSFALIFLVGPNPFLNTTTATTLAPLSVNITALQGDLAFVVTTAVPSALGDLALQILPTSAVGKVSTLQSIDAPSSLSGAAFLRVDLSFRNLLAPSNLTQSLVYQTRRGLQTFLGLVSLTQVTATGPAVVPPSSVLLLSQSYWIVLNNNASDATMGNRQRLANLLIYGDPSRLVPDPNAPASDPRPAMFLDFAVDASEPPMDPTVLLTLPYVFSSLSVDVFPVGNPPAPEPALPPGTVVIPATPTDQLLAMVRKHHAFSFASDSLYNTSDACPTTAGGGLCLKLQWNNTLDSMPFWIESIESVDALVWNVAPAVLFCAAMDTPLPLLPSPVVPLGPSPAVWAVAPLAPSTSRMAFALNLRSLDDNATRVHVEIAADIRSPLQAATTVTSIARRVNSDDGVPIYATRSNVVVTYDTTFTGTDLALALTLRASDVTQKDTSQPCAHCQNLYEWCAAQASCQALANCVFRDGLDAQQVFPTLFQVPSLLDDKSLVDVSIATRQCFASNADLDALLLFASAVRCQLQRQCTVRTPMDYSLVGLDDRVILWEATDGAVEVPVATPNVTMRLLDATLCTFSPATVALAPLVFEEFVTRQCAFANHLGRVVATVVKNGSAVEVRFQDLVGPLPTLDTAVVTALPGLALRLERADFATALPPLPVSEPPTPAELCRTTCRPLALDQCLRDSTCIAFTDCVTRTVDPTTSIVLGDALLGLFERRVVGESLSLQAAVDRCEPAVDEPSDVVRRAWRMLVDASACYAKLDCPLSLQGVVLPPASDGDAVVGKWRLYPSTVRAQRLLYEQQANDTDPTVSVALTYISQSTTSALDAAALTQTLRSLLKLDDLNVTLVADVTDPTTTRRTAQFDIAYAFWLGRLPRLLDASLAPRWRLVDLPSADPTNATVEIVAYTDSSSRLPIDSTSSTVELTMPAS